MLLPVVLASCSCSREQAAPSANMAQAVHGLVTEIVSFDDIRPHEKAVVKFYATWCGACKASKIPFEELAAVYSNVPFFAVDVDKASALAQQFNVSSIPTIIVFEKGIAREPMIGFDSAKLKQQLGEPQARVAESTASASDLTRAPGAILAITNVDQFQPEVLEIKGMPVIVKFYASWCGFCKMIAPAYKEMAQKYGDKVKFVEVEASNQKDLAHKFEIQGFPTFIIFIDGKQHAKFSGANKQKLESAVKAIYGS